MSEPLTHARIGHDTITRRGTVSASSEVSGFPASAAANELTYSAWKPTSMPAQLEVELTGREKVNFLGIASHDLLAKA